jgi:predicted CopG family antitoxin
MISTMPKIELSDSAYHRLLRQSTSFADSAEDVVLRLLDLAEHSVNTQPHKPNQREASRATPGSILPEREYWRPILDIIAEAGGSAAANDVIEVLGERMKDAFKARDLDLLKMGEVRWRNRARFARLRMREQGLLSQTSHRGLWEITDAGRRYLAGG